MTPNSLDLLHFLQYSTPLFVAGTVSLVSILSACLKTPSRRRVLDRKVRATLRLYALAVVFLFILEGLLHLAHILIHPNGEIEADAVTYISLSIFIWTSLSCILDECTTIYRSPVLASSVSYILSDGAILGISQYSRASNSAPDTLQYIMQLCRILCIGRLCASIMSIKSSKLLHSDEQQNAGPYANKESVKKSAALSQEVENSVDAQCDASGGLNDDFDDPQSAFRQERDQHVENMGGWWAYIQEFRVFLPLVFPTKDRKLQAAAAGLIVLIFLDRAAILLGPKLIGELVTSISSMRDEDEIPWKKVIIYVLGVVVPNEAVTGILRQRISTRLRYWSYGRLFSSTFGHVMSLSLDFHEHKSTAEVTSSVIQAYALSDFVDHNLNYAIPIVVDVTAALWYFISVFDVYFGIIMATTYLFWTLFTFKLTTWNARAQRSANTASARQEHIFSQAVSTWQQAANFNRQPDLQQRMDSATEELIQEMNKACDSAQYIKMMQNLVMTLAFGAVLLLAATQVKYNNKTVGDITTLLVYWNSFSRPLYGLSASYRNWIKFGVDAERLLKLFQMKPTVVDAPHARDLKFHGGQVSFEGVRFSYDGEDEVFKGLDFQVAPGSKVAFVGQTGSGKTTVCHKLLLRFYDVTEGSIRIDGQDLRDITLESLRNTVGIVEQTPSFNNDTVYEIMRFARPDATSEEIHDACKNAAIHEEISQFAKGYDTVIGERGAKLSGGAKQRLAIAQLFLRNPKIVVLDEATSAVDGITESEIQQSFAKICKGRTTFVIAHRLSTVMDADQIFVLDNGEIVERGTHTALLRLGGRYCKLWTIKMRTNEICSLERQLQMAGPFIDVDIGAEGIHSDFSDTDPTSSSDGMGLFDGSNESKHMEDPRRNKSRFRRLFHNPFHGSVIRESEVNRIEDANVETDDNVTMAVISPRPTNTEPPLRHSLSEKYSSRRSRSVKRRASILGETPSHHDTGLARQEIVPETEPKELIQDGPTSGPGVSGSLSCPAPHEHSVLAEAPESSAKAKRTSLSEQHLKELQEQVDLSWKRRSTTRVATMSHALSTENKDV